MITKLTLCSQLAQLIILPYLLCYCCLVAQLHLTLLQPHGLLPASSSIHGISQARILESVAIFFSRGIFLTQGLNLCLLHWQADSLPLSYQRDPPCLLVSPLKLLSEPLTQHFSCDTGERSLQSLLLQKLDAAKLLILILLVPQAQHLPYLWLENKPVLKIHRKIQLSVRNILDGQTNEQ